MAEIFGTTTTTPMNPDIFSGGGNGQGIIVDQTYNPESANAQSGKAVAEAIKNINNDGTNAGVGGGSGDNWELINKITTTEDVKRIMCTMDSSGKQFLLKKVVFIVRSQPSTNANDNASLYYLISTYKTRTNTSTTHQIGELSAGLRTTAQNNSAYVERKCYIPSAKNNNSNGIAHFDIVTGELGTIKPKYQIRDISATRDEEYITCAYVESGSDTTIFGAGTELEIWGVRA